MPNRHVGIVYVSDQILGFLRLPRSEVFTGILQEEAEQLNQAFFHFIKYGKPYVTLKAASTLDGKLSDANWGRQMDYIR